MLAQEEGRWAATLISHFGPAAPSEMSGFIEFTHALPAPYIYEVVRNAAPVGEASGHTLSSECAPSLRKVGPLPGRVCRHGRCHL
jgi:hypothetical protein